MPNLTDRQTATDVVAGVIQRVYGDAAQTVLDRRAASAIVSALRGMGWASVDEVGALILAAGGKVAVGDAELRRIYDGDITVTVEENYRTTGKTFRAR